MAGVAAEGGDLVHGLVNVPDLRRAVGGARTEVDTFLL